MNTKIHYNKDNKEQVERDIESNGYTILAECIHFDGTYFLVDIPERDLATEIDLLKARIEEMEKKQTG